MSRRRFSHAALPGLFMVQRWAAPLRDLFPPAAGGCDRSGISRKGGRIATCPGAQVPSAAATLTTPKTLSRVPSTLSL